MRTWASALAILACLVGTEPALADSPAEVYSDFAEDGALSCGHSRSALKRVLNDASLYQYGDPLTFIQLKLAIRKQLANGCRRRIASRTGGGASPPPDESRPAGGDSTPSMGAKPTRRPPGSGSDQPRGQGLRLGTKSGDEDSKQSGGMVLLGVGLLLLALGSGGWGARRAFGDRE